MGKYKKTIAHSEDCLPELDIQYGFSRFSGVFKRVGSIPIDPKFNFAFASVFTKKYPRTGNTMDFTLES